MRGVNAKRYTCDSLVADKKKRGTLCAARRRLQRRNARCTRLRVALRLRKAGGLNTLHQIRHGLARKLKKDVPFEHDIASTASASATRNESETLPVIEPSLSRSERKCMRTCAAQEIVQRTARDPQDSSSSSNKIKVVNAALETLRQVCGTQRRNCRSRTAREEEERTGAMAGTKNTCIFRRSKHTRSYAYTSKKDGTYNEWRM